MKNNNKTHGKVNVVSDIEFKTRLQDVISTCAEVVGKTLGPYGKNTLLQTEDGIIKTKDGWNVLKGLKFNTIIDNSIKGAIEEIASQVVLKVGDGSTTSIVAANHMNRILGEFLEDKNIASRDLDGALRNAVSLIIEQLEKNSTKIESSGLKEFMYKIALVSTNWDNNTADMISDIISRTNNPVIKTEYSGTDSTEVKIVEDSFDINGELVEKVFINNNETSSCDLENPMVLVFDHTVREDYIGILVEYYISKNIDSVRPLIVMAPEFSDRFKTDYNRYLMTSINGNRGIPVMVPVKYIRATNFDRLCVKDFAMMCGGSLMTSAEELTDLIKKSNQSYNDESTEQFDVVSKITGIFDAHLGECEKACITNKLISISGLTNRNEEEYQKVLAVASNGLGEKLKESTAMSMLTEDVKLRKYRLGKLQCKMGTIKLGGFGQADLKAKKDALDDAILACEAAYYNGYNIGSSMAVPLACTKIDFSKIGQLESGIISCIIDTFIEVFRTIVSNKCDSKKYQTVWNMQDGKQQLVRFDDIIRVCVEHGLAFNLISDMPDMDKLIINPTTTDIEILKGMLNIVLMNFTSNQFLFKHFEDEQIC